jgi:hypothetical protein
MPPLPSYELTTHATFKQVALLGVPIAVAMPPNGLGIAPGSLVRDRTAGKFYILGSNGASAYEWAEIPGGSGLLAPLNYTVFAAKNGNDGTADGSISKPFLTVQAAMDYAWTTYVLPFGPQPAPPFLRPCVFVSAGTYDDGPLILPPQICVEGEGGNFTRIKGDWALDDRWSNYVPPSLPSPPSVLVPNDFRSAFLNVGIYGNCNFDFDAHFSNEGKLWFAGVRFAGTVTLTEKLANPSSNQAYFLACEHLDNVTLNGMNTQMVAPMFTSAPPPPDQIGASIFLNQHGSPPDNNGTNYLCTYGGSVGNIIVTAPAAMPVPPCELRLGHATQPGATLGINGAYAVVFANADALPLQASIVLVGGATRAQIRRVNQPNFSGPAAERPAVPYEGEQYFDTSIVPPRPIWWNGAAWIDAAGGLV